MLFIDISTMINLPTDYLNEMTQSFNVPYSQFGQGTYFGDQECLTQLDKIFPWMGKQRPSRDSTAIADKVTGIVLTIKKTVLLECLKNFTAIKLYMEALAEEKLRSHLTQISSIVDRYNDNQYRSEMISEKKINWDQTTRMSLKR